MEGASLGSRESFIGSCFILFVLAGVMGCRGARITFGRPSFGGDLGGGVLDSFIRNFSPLPTRLTPDRQESYSSSRPRFLLDHVRLHGATLARSRYTIAISLAHRVKKETSSSSNPVTSERSPLDRISAKRRR